MGVVSECVSVVGSGRLLPAVSASRARARAVEGTAAAYVVGVVSYGGGALVRQGKLGPPWLAWHRARSVGWRKAVDSLVRGWVSCGKGFS